MRNVRLHFISSVNVIIFIIFLSGYEIIGLEKIPNSGPALLIYYHGAIPIDFYYIMAKVILYKSRMIRAVGDRFLFKTPGINIMSFHQNRRTLNCLDIG